MVDCIKIGEDPIKKVDILLVLRWALFAKEEVLKETIANCWVKSTCLGRPHTVIKKPKG